MTSKLRRRKAPPEMAALRFLLEDFIDVTDEPQGDDEVSVGGIRVLQERAARVFLPGPTGKKRGEPFTPQQLSLMVLSVEQFTVLRRTVRDWLARVVRDPGASVTLKGPLMVYPAVRVAGHGRLELPYLESANMTGGKDASSDVFWYYLAHLISRAGVSMIGVCHAPKSKREAEEQQPDHCSRLFVKRGRAKEFCSDRCRARVATQRARGQGTKKGKKS